MQRIYRKKYTFGQDLKSFYCKISKNIPAVATGLQQQMIICAA